MPAGALRAVMLMLAASSPPPVDGDSVEVPGPSAALFLQYRLLARDVLARSCRYEPSCSHYAEEAVDSLGLLLGLPMGLERWTRCHGDAGEDGLYPLGPGGLLRDPPFRREEGGDPSWSSLALPF